MLVDVTLVQIILCFLTHLRHLRIVLNEHYACVLCQKYRSNHKYEVFGPACSFCTANTQRDF